MAILNVLAPEDTPWSIAIRALLMDGVEERRPEGRPGVVLLDNARMHPGQRVTVAEVDEVRGIIWLSSKPVWQWLMAEGMDFDRAYATVRRALRGTPWVKMSPGESFAAVALGWKVSTETND